MPAPILAGPCPRASAVAPAVCVDPSHRRPALPALLPSWAMAVALPPLRSLGAASSAAQRPSRWPRLALACSLRRRARCASTPAAQQPAAPLPAVPRAGPHSSMPSAAAPTAPQNWPPRRRPYRARSRIRHCTPLHAPAHSPSVSHSLLSRTSPSHCGTASASFAPQLRINPFPWLRVAAVAHARLLVLLASEAALFSAGPGFHAAAVARTARFLLLGTSPTAPAPSVARLGPDLSAAAPPCTEPA